MKVYAKDKDGKLLAGTVKNFTPELYSKIQQEMRQNGAVSAVLVCVK